MIRIKVTNLSVHEKFRVETFTVIMDNLDKKFDFLIYFKSITEKKIMDMAKNLTR